MSTKRWDRIGSAFSRLIDLPTGEKAERLARLAQDDPTIHSDVTALISADGRADQRLRHYERGQHLKMSPHLDHEPDLTRSESTHDRVSDRIAALPPGDLSRSGSLRAHLLAPDLLRRAADRLQLVSAVISISLAVYIVVSSSGSLGVGPDLGQTTPTRLVFLGMLVVSIAVYFLGRFRWLSPERMLDVGLIYEVVLAFSGGVAVQLFASELRMPMWGVSEVVVLILLFAVLVPNTPGKVLTASLVAATMDPIGDVIYSLRSGTDLSLANMVGAYYANYLAAGIAVVAAHVLTRLQREVSEARELGSYRLVDLLGRGGMGEVWRADHRMLARPAAIKLIRPDVLLDIGEDRQALVQRFEREAQATAALSSPHTIQLYDFGTTPEGAFYYVMELLDGLELQQLVERFGPVPPGRAVYILEQVCNSLVEAHAQGLIHRDIKPANIYVCRYGLETDFVKLLDFGLVGRRPGIAGDEQLTMGVCPGGTPAFMAPEQILGDKPVDGRTDIYALGCVAFWLLTGRCVFLAETPMEALVKHARERPELPSRVSEVPIPDSLDTLVLACLDKDPDLRPPSARALRGRLGSCDVDPWTAKEADGWWSLHLPCSR